jgi:c-di-GMP-binding flagellar brake protein YcgR
MDSLKILQDCSTYKAPALIFNTEAGIYCHARIQVASKENIILELLGPLALLPENSLCCVSFRHQGRSLAFLSKVKEYSRLPSPGILIIGTPATVCGIEARSAFRVPVFEESGLLVSVLNFDGSIFKANPLNLSLTGILIDFGGLQDRRFQPGFAITVQLELPPYAVRLPAEIRTNLGNQYGILFQGVMTSKGLSPPDELREIYSIVEQTWLKRRMSGPRQ